MLPFLANPTLTTKTTRLFQQPTDKEIVPIYLSAEQIMYFSLSTRFYLADQHQDGHHRGNTQAAGFCVRVVNGIVDEAFVSLLHSGDGAAALVVLALVSAAVRTGQRCIAGLCRGSSVVDTMKNKQLRSDTCVNFQK